MSVHDNNVIEEHSPIVPFAPKRSNSYPLKTNKSRGKDNVTVNGNGIGNGIGNENIRGNDTPRKPSGIGALLTVPNSNLFATGGRVSRTVNKYGNVQVVYNTQFDMNERTTYIVNESDEDSDIMEQRERERAQRGQRQNKNENVIETGVLIQKQNEPVVITAPTPAGVFFSFFLFFSWFFCLCFSFFFAFANVFSKSKKKKQKKCKFKSR